MLRQYLYIKQADLRMVSLYILSETMINVEHREHYFEQQSMSGSDL